MSYKYDEMAFCCGELLTEIIKHSILNRSYAAPFTHNLNGYGLEHYCNPKFWIRALQNRRRVLDDIYNDPSGCFGTIDLSGVLAAIRSGIPAKHEFTDARYPSALLLHIITSEFTNCFMLADVCQITKDELIEVVKFCRTNPARLGYLATQIEPHHISLSPDIAMIIGESAEQLNEDIRTQQLLTLLKMNRKKIKLITKTPATAIAWMGTHNSPGRPLVKMNPKLEGLIVHAMNLYQSNFNSLAPVDLFTQIVRFIVEFYEDDEDQEMLLKQAGQHIGPFMGQLARWTQSDVRRCENECQGMNLNIAINPAIKTMASQICAAVDVII